MSIVAKILSQKVLGYSSDFKETYTQHEVLMSSGEVKIMYSTNVLEGETVYLGKLTDGKPIVEIDINGRKLT